jgi:hypothetical protein
MSHTKIAQFRSMIEAVRQSEVYVALSRTYPWWTKEVVITGISKANPAVVTAPGHTFVNGDTITIVSVLGMTQVNKQSYTVTSANVGAGTFRLLGVDSTGFSNYVSGGKAYILGALPTDFDSVSVTRHMRDISCAKKVLLTDVCICASIPDWTSGHSYDINTFVVSTTTKNIYMCVGVGGGASTVRPTGTNYLSYTAGDGYQWVFLYTVPDADWTNFYASGEVPVRTIQVNDGSANWTAAVSGSAYDLVRMTNPATLKFRTTIFGNENGSITIVPYGTWMLLMSPFSRTRNTLKQTIYDLVGVATVGNTGAFSEGERVIGTSSNASATVGTINSSTVMYLTGITDDFIVGETLTGEGPGSTTLTAYNPPDFTHDWNSGLVIAGKIFNLVTRSSVGNDTLTFKLSL